MAASAVLAPTKGQGASSDITLAAGTTATVSLFTAAGGGMGPDGRAFIYRKNSSGTYNPTGTELSSVPLSDNRYSYASQVIQGPGVFQVYKLDSYLAIGIDLDQ